MRIGDYEYTCYRKVVAHDRSAEPIMVLYFEKRKAMTLQEVEAMMSAVKIKKDE